MRQVSYMNKKGYGKVPAYLEKVKSEIQDEYNYIMQMQEAANEEMDDEGYGRTRMLSEQERIEMLNGMKTNWDRINKAYQTLSFTLDTPAKKQRKEEFEAQLEQLERDIERCRRPFFSVQWRHWPHRSEFGCCHSCSHNTRHPVARILTPLSYFPGSRSAMCLSRRTGDMNKRARCQCTTIVDRAAVGALSRGPGPAVRSTHTHTRTHTNAHARASKAKRRSAHPFTARAPAALQVAT